MKKLACLLIFVLALFSIKSIAQPTFYMTPQPNTPIFNVQVEEGESICKTIKVVDFTDIIAVDQSINWDPTVLQFTAVQNIHPDLINASMADFDTSPGLVNNGQLTFSWVSSDDIPCDSPPPNMPPGVTLDDEEILYEVCYEVIGGYAGFSQVEITDVPLEKYVTRLNANCNDIEEFINDNCSVSVDVTPLTFNISSVSGAPGDIVCVSVSVDEFEEIVSMQYSMEWDCDVVSLESVQTSNLSNFLVGQNVNVNDCFLTVSWLDFSDGESLPNGTAIMDLCFEIIGEGGDCSIVTVTDTPTDIEIVNNTSQNLNGENINVLVNEGTVCVDIFNEDGIGLAMEDQTVCVGESFEVDVTVQDFFEIRNLAFSLAWNPFVLQFENVTNINDEFPGTFIYPGAFDISQTNQGKLGVEWQSSSILTTETLNDNEVLFTLNFTVVGSGGSNSVVSIANDPVPINITSKDSSPDNIGVNSDNALITVKPSIGLTAIADSGEGFPGEEICIDITVQDFDDIERMSFTMNWNGNANVLEYSHVTGFGLPDMEDFNFMDDQAVSGNFLGVEWEPFGPAVTVPDGSVIFQVCFTIIGDPGECTDITFGDIPFPVDIINSSSNGANIGLNGQAGEVCVLNPLEFVVTASNEFGAPGTESCVSFTFDNFSSLTQTQYSINFDPTILEYASLNPTGALASFDATSFDDDFIYIQEGNIIINWSADNQIIGETVANGEEIFEVCFNVIGDAGECSPIVVSGSPMEIIVNSAPTGNSNLGLSNNAGSVCVSDFLSVVDTIITDVGCPGDNSGGIDLVVNGGSNEYSYLWSGPNINAGNQNSPVPFSGLTNGTYNVTISDTGGLELEVTVVVGVSADAPVADAGEDFALPCFELGDELQGGGSSSGPTIEYAWTALGLCGSEAGLILPANDDLVNPQFIGNDCYELMVTDISTGCSVRDTVEVFASQTPFVDAGLDMEVSCSVDTVQLDATNSTTSTGFVFEWTTADGGQIKAGTEDSIEPTAEAPGTYILTITHEGSGCFAVDTVLVMGDTIAPPADAGAPQGLGCNDESVVLDASGTGAGFIYQWFTNEGEICSMDPNQESIEACAIAEYFVLVTDPDNGCFAVDTVMVMGDTLKPISNAGPDTLLTCLSEMITLDGSGSTMGSDTISYSWTFGGMEVGENINLEITEAGVYTLVVTNDNNGCTAISSVEVAESIDAPAIEVAALLGELTCFIPMDTLTVSSDAPNSTFSWMSDMGTEFDGEVISVDEAGTYSVTVTNEDNGCTTTESVEVAPNNNPPQIDAGDDQFINCVQDVATLSGSTEAGLIDPLIQWSISFPVNCLDNSNDLNTEATCAGTYFLTVQNTENGCIAVDSVMVGEDMTQPELESLTGGTITCEDLMVDLTATLVDPSLIDEVTINWELNDQPYPGNDLVVSVDQPGTYTITVTHDVSGCTETGVFIPNVDQAFPMADGGADGQVTCNDPMAEIDGSASLIPTETSIQWFDTNIPGGPIGTLNETIVPVGAGCYQLIVTDLNNGCVAIDTVCIADNTTPPMVDAGDDQSRGCTTEFATLTGSGSADVGMVVLEWFAPDGVTSVGTGTSVEVPDAGEYTLIVTNTTTGCTASDIAAVTLTVDGDPADAMVDSDPCTNEAALFGNLPGGATGMWSALNSGTFMMADTNETIADNLIEGNNAFVWTLSIGTCDDYSSDTVFVETLLSALNANNDVLAELPAGTTIVTENVLNNDLIGGMNISFDTVGAPAVGRIDSIAPDGTLVYVADEGFFGEVDIFYEICSEDCPDVCDTAFWRITIARDVSTTNEAPNGITPNGDGLNDELIFDELLYSPEEFPNNQLIIFNRWGDTVFEAQPYLNDWQGTNQSGKPLPDGTYYYILRLDIGQSEIIRGDVTIVK